MHFISHIYSIESTVRLLIRNINLESLSSVQSDITITSCKFHTQILYDTLHCIHFFCITSIDGFCLYLIAFSTADEISFCQIFIGCVDRRMAERFFEGN